MRLCRLWLAAAGEIETLTDRTVVLTAVAAMAAATETLVS